MVIKLFTKLLQAIVEGLIGGGILAGSIFVCYVVIVYPDLLWAFVCIASPIFVILSIASLIRAKRWQRTSL